MTNKPRRPPNLTEKVAILKDQALCACFDCRTNKNGRAKLVGERIEYHHMDEHAISGDNSTGNLVAIIAGHHKRETNKPNGSKAKVARAKRLERARQALAFAAMTPAVQAASRIILGPQPYMKQKRRLTGEEERRIFADANRPMLRREPGLMFPKPQRKRSKWKIPTRKKR